MFHGQPPDGGHSRSPNPFVFIRQPGIQGRQPVGGVLAHDRFQGAHGELVGIFQNVYGFTDSAEVCKFGTFAIRLATYAELKPKQQKHLREQYIENIYPLVTPQAMDPAHPFPFVSNLSLNLLVSLHYPNDPAPLLAEIDPDGLAGLLP